MSSSAYRVAVLSTWFTSDRFPFAGTTGFDRSANRTVPSANSTSTVIPAYLPCTCGGGWSCAYEINQTPSNVFEPTPLLYAPRAHDSTASCAPLGSRSQIAYLISAASRGLEVLNHLRASSIDWTSFCPASFFEPGERTGKFRLGADDLISDANRQSRISMEDYAIALVDEFEDPRHIRSRFTIGY